MGDTSADLSASILRPGEGLVILMDPWHNRAPVYTAHSFRASSVPTSLYVFRLTIVCSSSLAV